MHLLQVYSNRSRPAVSPQELLFRSGQSERPDLEPGAPVGRARQLHAAETVQLVQRYLEVRNMRQVAREFRVSRTTVAKLLTEGGVDTSRGMKPAEVQQAVRLYEKGLSSMIIGKRLGYNNHTVLKEIRRAGVKVGAKINDQ